jgi:biotin transport system permease protein
MRAFDPRLKILLALLLAILAWRSGAAGLLAYAAALAIIPFAGRGRLPAGGGILRFCGAFVLLWGVLRGLFDWLNGSPAPQAISGGALFGLRLAVLLAAGLALTATTSPRRLGLAFAWFLRPVLRARAWRAALALSLMIHYLPITLGTLATVRATVGRRCPHRPLASRMRLLSEATLRALSLRTWDQTLAVAARGLDRPEAWRGGMRWRVPELLAGAMAALAGIGAAAL